MGCVTDEPVVTVWAVSLMSLLSLWGVSLMSLLSLCGVCHCVGSLYGMDVCVESCDVYCSLCMSPLQMEILYSSYVASHPKAVAVLTDNS